MVNIITYKKYLHLIVICILNIIIFEKYTWEFQYLNDNCIHFIFLYIYCLTSQYLYYFIFISLYIYIYIYIPYAYQKVNFIIHSNLLPNA